MVPVEVLIKGMIVQSGNDATIALAEKVGGTEDAFAQMMNAYAKRLGMKGTHFTNSCRPARTRPLHARRATSRRCRAPLIREFPQYYKCYSMREFAWNSIKQQNRNGLLAATRASMASRPATPKARSTACSAPPSATACG